ncbi:hypothetical protein V7156_15335, partial [Priestia megaterium]|uniref:hypothetical protein n=2 Tax=Priestia megaterium TaxID=1404 RepID=UPI003009BD6B
NEIKDRLNDSFSYPHEGLSDEIYPYFTKDLKYKIKGKIQDKKDASQHVLYTLSQSTNAFHILFNS